MLVHLRQRVVREVVLGGQLAEGGQTGELGKRADLRRERGEDPGKGDEGGGQVGI